MANNKSTLKPKELEVLKAKSRLLSEDIFAERMQKKERRYSITV